MPKGASGTETYSGVSGPVDAREMRLAEQRVMGIAANVLENVIDRIPEIQPFLNLMEFNEADITTPGVLGFYQTPSVGGETSRIVIGERALSMSAGQRGHLAVPTLDGVIAHEIGHALSFHTQPGFRSVDRAINIAHQRHNRGNPDKSNKGDFVRSISNYAGSSAHEAFAEAFADWTVNGTNAARASQLIIRSWQSR